MLFDKLNIINKILISLVFISCIVYPVYATATAELLWTKPVGDVFNYPTYIDTWDNGTAIYVGMSNGSIISYDLNGDVRWFYQTNASIKKIVSNANGTTAWINNKNESGIIQDDVAYNYYYPDTMRNLTDVAISRDGSYYAMSELSSARITIISNIGSLIQNTSYGIANWTNIAYDPYSRWVVTSNASDNKLYLWNLTIYNGWVQFNPTKASPKNASQTNLDQFPYRRNISLANYTGSTHLYFINTTNATISTIYQINATYYWLNATNTGKYSYWTSYGNISDNASVMNASYWSQDMLTIGLKPNMKNLTFYYGNKTFTNEIFNATNTTSSYTSVTNTSWSVPAGTVSILYEVVGGGGAGGQSYSSGDHGTGGSHGARVTGTLVIAKGQTSVNTSVGQYGAGTVPGQPGNASTLNDTIVAGGGGQGGVVAGTANGDPGQDGYWLTAGTFAASGGSGSYGSGGAGGAGYSAGGGGAGSSSTTNPGGHGARGYINITYMLKTNYMGVDQNISWLGPEQTRTIDNSIGYVGTQTLTGNISDMDVPEMGGWLSASTDSPKVYHQQITITGSVIGFGTQYSGTANTGTSRMIKTSDSAAYTTEARDLFADIYQLDGTRKGTYTTGGIVNAVDVSVKNGLWSIAGGDDGKVYIFSKDSTSSWYVFYQGDTGEPIKAVATSWRGEYMVVGRTDGNLEYYSTSGAASSTSTAYMVNVFVNKGGVPYKGANITVTKGTSPDSAIDTYTSGKTDSSGKFSFTGEDLTYYKIDVNGGEYIYSYQASSTYTTITINIPTPMITRPYDYSTSYDDNTYTITTNYQDVDMVSAATVSIVDLSTNNIVHTGSYAATNTITDTYVCGVANKSHEYKVNIQFTRTTGHQYTDTMYVKSSTFSQPTTVPTTQWLLFKYAIYSVLLMFMALGIGSASTKWGVIILPAMAVLGIMIGFLPMNIYTGGLLVSAFIAMLEVMRRRQD